ncbi:MAG: hypothetical protein M5R36_29470 [Deltaproteobacteria bacterium]|nr:hypothetical protein [Deltaproteobacteria bacterium]
MKKYSEYRREGFNEYDATDAADTANGIVIVGNTAAVEGINLDESQGTIIRYDWNEGLSWDRLFPGGESIFDGAYDGFNAVSIGSDGAAYIAGWRFSAEPSRSTIVKYSVIGDLQWEFVTDGSGFTDIEALGNGFIAAVQGTIDDPEPQLTVVVIDEEQNEIVRHEPFPGVEGEAHVAAPMAASLDHSVFAASGAAYADNGDERVLVALYLDDGTFQWARELSTAVADPRFMAFDTTGNLIVMDSSYEVWKIDLDGKILWHWEREDGYATNLQIDGDENVYLLGRTTFVDQEESDFVFTKLDGETGMSVWESAYDNSSSCPSSNDDDDSGDNTDDDLSPIGDNDSPSDNPDDDDASCCGC